MNASINHRRLDTMARQIERLQEVLIEAERDALRIYDDERMQNAQMEYVASVRIALDAALREYFVESEFVRYERRTQLGRCA